MYIHRMLLGVLVIVVGSACERTAPIAPNSIAPSGLAGMSSGHQHVNVDVTPDMRQQLAALHPQFARYHDLDKALADGYEFVGPCVSDPALGGMGDHYSLNAEIDFGRGDGTYALDKPQYLVYAPQKNGGRRLAALDYTVPYEKWHSAEPPEFFGIPFTRNDGFGVWMFHIWLFEHNPAGMFANFNPTVPQC
jgi:hypothetical protein